MGIIEGTLMILFLISLWVIYESQRTQHVQQEIE